MHKTARGAWRDGTLSRVSLFWISNHFSYSHHTATGVQGHIPIKNRGDNSRVITRRLISLNVFQRCWSDATHSRTRKSLWDSFWPLALAELWSLLRLHSSSTRCPYNRRRPRACSHSILLLPLRRLRLLGLWRKTCAFTRNHRFRRCYYPTQFLSLFRTVFPTLIASISSIAALLFSYFSTARSFTSSALSPCMHTSLYSSNLLHRSTPCIFLAYSAFPSPAPHLVHSVQWNSSVMLEAVAAPRTTQYPIPPASFLSVSFPTLLIELCADYRTTGSVPRKHLHTTAPFPTNRLHREFVRNWHLSMEPMDVYVVEATIWNFISKLISF